MAEKKLSKSQLTFGERVIIAVFEGLVAGSKVRKKAPYRSRKGKGKYII